MHRSWLGALVGLVLLSTGCHDLDDLSGPGKTGGGGNGGTGGSSGSSGEGGEGGSSGSSGIGGSGGDGGGGSGGSGGNGDLFCGGVNCEGLANPTGDELCCTAPGTGDPNDDNLSLTGRGPDQCGVTFGDLDPPDDRCWQLDQPGDPDGNCPDHFSDSYGTVAGCCTDEGYCGLQVNSLGLGCTYALDGVGHPCGDNPIQGCHPTEGPGCTFPEVCRPAFIADRQVGTYACIDPSMIPEYGHGADCSEGWYDVSTAGGSVSADPCAEGLVCVQEPNVSSGWTCLTYCDENQPCGSGSERCYSYSDPQGHDLRYPACKPTDSCILGSGQGICGVGEACYLSYDWYALHAHDECLVTVDPVGAIGDECTDLAGCPINAVCIGPLGVDPASWGDGDPAHAFRCTEICGAVGSVSCPNCTDLGSWGMYPYDDIASSVSLCPLPPLGGVGGSGGSGGSGGGGG